MNLEQFRQHILDKKLCIVYEGPEDEGAANYEGELESIIQTIDEGGDYAAVLRACMAVGEPCLLTPRKTVYIGTKADREKMHKKAMSREDGNEQY